MTALSRRRRARTGDQLGLVHFQVATDPRYIFKWPELVHFEWPPRVQREQYKALVDEVRGPAVPKLSGDALKHAQKGSFS